MTVGAIGDGGRLEDDAGATGGCKDFVACYASVKRVPKKGELMIDAEAMPSCSASGRRPVLAVAR
jgi:hypothetical protein